MLDLCAWMTTTHEDGAMCGLGDRTQHGRGNALGLAAGFSLNHGVSMHPFIFVVFPPSSPHNEGGRAQPKPSTHPPTMCQANVPPVAHIHNQRPAEVTEAKGPLIAAAWELTIQSRYATLNEAHDAPWAPTHTETKGRSCRQKKKNEAATKRHTAMQ
ncbi:hypothetical protein TcCL_NonESM04811 [Trypanosoma cruzi]|nr:hypothetical protein TcCL_NonESM04811 [Trypanosoma cruzi]